MLALQPQQALRASRGPLWPASSSGWPSTLSSYVSTTQCAPAARLAPGCSCSPWGLPQVACRGSVRQRRTLASNLDVVESVEDKVNEATGAVSKAQDKVMTHNKTRPTQAQMLVGCA